MAVRRKPPLRMCLGCGTQRPKRELMRIVRTPEGVVQVDATGRANGRGAYICPQRSCLREAARKKRIERALEAPVADELLDAIEQRLPPDA